MLALLHPIKKLVLVPSAFTNMNKTDHLTIKDHPISADLTSGAWRGLVFGVAIAPTLSAPINLGR